MSRLRVDLTTLTVLSVLAVLGCTFPPPPPAVVLTGAERVRVQEMSEEGDAWLFEHCVYKGTMATLGDAGARARAIEKGANFAEPMLHTKSSSQTSTNGAVTSYRSTESETFAAFYCPAFPPETVQ